MRPQIVIIAGQTKRIVDEVEVALIASDLPLYQRGARIVSPGLSKLPTWNKGKITAYGLIGHSAARIVEDAESVTDFLRPNDKGVLIPCGCPMRLAVTLMARERDLRFPVIASLATTPSITPDGELLDRPGFDPTTGVLYDPLGVVYPRVPERPTESDTLAAFERLMHVLHTFDPDFIKPQDKGVALSILMTAVVRRSLDHAPLHALDAPVAGSGKSLIIDIASIIATGHGAIVMSQGDTQEEFTKAFGAVLMRGDSMIAIDNCDLPLEGMLLNQTLTQGMVQPRILGKSETVVIQCSAFITATGNNIRPKGDMVRRSLVGRLDPRCERPELRPYDFDPVAYALENRPQLVSDILTLLKAWHQTKRPNCPPDLQSFVHWSQTVRGCIAWLGGMFPEAKLDDPRLTMERIRTNDPILAGLQATLSAWRSLFASDSTTVAKAVKTAEGARVDTSSLTMAEAMRVDEMRGTLRDAFLMVAGKGGRIDVRALGNWLSRHEGRLVQCGDRGLRIERHPTLKDGNVQWKVKEGAA